MTCACASRADRPVLAALATASVLGLPPAGPARRKPKLIALRGHGDQAEPTIKSRLCAGATVHGAVAAASSREMAGKPEAMAASMVCTRVSNWMWSSERTCMSDLSGWAVFKALSSFVSAW